MSENNELDLNIEQHFNMLSNSVLVFEKGRIEGVLAANYLTAINLFIESHAFQLYINDILVAQSDGEGLDAAEEIQHVFEQGFKAMTFVSEELEKEK